MSITSFVFQVEPDSNGAYQVEVDDADPAKTVWEELGDSVQTLSLSEERVMWVSTCTCHHCGKRNRIASVIASDSGVLPECGYVAGTAVVTALDSDGAAAPLSQDQFDVMLWELGGK